MRAPLLLPPRPDFSFERAAMSLWPVAGVDEAGRGPLAGPVVAAAVVLDPERLPEGIDDSKALSEAARERLFTLILRDALSVSLASSSATLIDGINIRQATLSAMARAVRGLSLAPKHVLVDGRDVPSLPAGVSGEAVVKGDARSLSIAAASIVAKVTRDRMMQRAESCWPGYGFAVHKGYGTAAHRAAMEMRGHCPLHRLTFGALKA